MGFIPGKKIHPDYGTGSTTEIPGSESQYAKGHFYTVEIKTGSTTNEIKD